MNYKNPYQSPIAPTQLAHQPTKLHWSTIFWMLTPLMWLALVHCAWLVAWVQLGYPPRPSLDDPKSISPTVTCAYYVSMSAVVAGPVCAFFSAAKLLLARGAVAARIALAMLCIAFWFAALMWLRSDVWRIADWLMD